MKLTNNPKIMQIHRAAIEQACAGFGMTDEYRQTAVNSYLQQIESLRIKLHKEFNVNIDNPVTAVATAMGFLIGRADGIVSAKKQS